MEEFVNGKDRDWDKVTFHTGSLMYFSSSIYSGPDPGILLPQWRDLLGIINTSVFSAYKVTFKY